MILASKPSKRVLALGNKLGLETAGAIARDRQTDLAILGQDGLGPRAVAAVAAAAPSRIALFVTEMIGKLGAQRPLDQRLLQLLENPVIAGQIFRLLIARQQLVEQLGGNRRFRFRNRPHVSLHQKVNSQKPAYTLFRTPSATERCWFNHDAIFVRWRSPRCGVQWVGDVAAPLRARAGCGRAADVDRGREHERGPALADGGRPRLGGRGGRWRISPIILN